MPHKYFEQTRIRQLTLPTSFDTNKIQIGIPVDVDEAMLVGLYNVGESVLPSSDFGCVSKRNACGDEYADKSQPKRKRYINTIWVQPFGNDYASPSPVDVYRKCYPKVMVPPIGIEFVLYENSAKKRFVLADLTEEIRENHLVDVVNLFLEIYGRCYVFDGEIDVTPIKKRRRCNWELLPPGEKPSVHLTRQLKEQGVPHDTFDVNRLYVLDRYDVEFVAEGINGFGGYYAYIFKKHCVLESAAYGNATYIIPKENWESLSQRTKQELLDEDWVVAKIIHTSDWKYEIRRVIRKLEGQ